MDTPQISHQPERKQYTLTLDGAEIGYAKYQETPTQRVFTHTVVEPEFGGRGYATSLIDFAVADTRSDDKRIVGECPMVAHWLTKHPELADYVDAPSES
jgi:predicted GNAT family acetyltransferase